MESVNETVEAAKKSIIYSHDLLSRVTHSVVGLQEEGTLTAGECIKAASRGYAKLRDAGDITDDEFSEAVSEIVLLGATGSTGPPTKAITPTGRVTMDTLFDEVVNRVNVYIKSSAGAPQIIKDDFKARGWNISLKALFGYDAFESAFCTSYPAQLEHDLRLLKTDTEEDAARFAEVKKYVQSKCDEYSEKLSGDRGRVKRIFNWDTVPGTGDDKLLRNLKSIYGLDWAKHAEISKSDDDETITISSGDKIAEITINDAGESAVLQVDDDIIFMKVVVEKGDRILYRYRRNHLRYFGKLWTDEEDLTVKMTALQLKGGSLSPKDLNREIAISSRYKLMGNLRSRIRRYFRVFGLFILYLEIKGIPISNVDADVFETFQSAYKIRTGTISEDTLNNLRRDLMIFLTKHLARKEYLKPIPYEDEGSIPKRAYDVETVPEPPEVFTLKVDGKGRLTQWKPEDPNSTEVSDDVRSVYEMVRVTQFGRDPKLIEICLRMLRETGLRPEFAYRIRFGDITSEPVTHSGKTPMYHLKLEGLRKFETPKKKLPHYDMYISGLLGEMIKKYKKDYTTKTGVVLNDRFRLFNGVMLLGWKKGRYATLIAESGLRKNIFVPLSEKCGTRVRAEKFRDSYFTLMLDALHVTPVANEDADTAFQRWTGDLKRTAKTHYESVAKYIVLPQQYKGGMMTYQEIVAKVFQKETVAKTCNEGELAHPYNCPDGSRIYLKRCHDGVWTKSGNRCPK